MLILLFSIYKNNSDQLEQPSDAKTSITSLIVIAIVIFNICVSLCWA